MNIIKWAETNTLGTIEYFYAKGGWQNGLYTHCEAYLDTSCRVISSGDNGKIGSITRCDWTNEVIHHHGSNRTVIGIIWSWSQINVFRWIAYLFLVRIYATSLWDGRPRNMLFAVTKDDMVRARKHILRSHLGLNLSIRNVGLHSRFKVCLIHRGSVWHVEYENVVDCAINSVATYDGNINGRTSHLDIHTCKSRGPGNIACAIEYFNCESSGLDLLAVTLDVGVHAPNTIGWLWVKSYGNTPRILCDGTFSLPEVISV